MDKTIIIMELFAMFFGGIGLLHVLFNFILLALGVGLSLYFHVRRGINNCKDSPNIWDWDYFWKKNKFRAVSGGIIFIFVWANMGYFVDTFVASWLPHGLANWSPFIVGLLMDRIYVWLNDLTKKNKT